MGLLEKFKDLFTDVEEVVEPEEPENIIETEEEPQEEQNKLPTFMRKKIEKEEQEKVIALEKKEQVANPTNADDLLKNTNKFRFPIDYDDTDFSAQRLSRTENYNYFVEPEVREVKKEPVTPPVKPKPELYSKGNKEKKKEEKKFIATPIISPVYGVLDKNYHKDEVKAKDDTTYIMQRPSKKVDFESVRNKAFGTLSDDIKDNMCENCEFLREIKDSIKLETISENDLLYNMTEELPKENITLEEAQDNYYDFGVEYDGHAESNDDVKIVNHNDEESVAEQIDVKDEDSNDVTNIINNALDDDFDHDYQINSNETIEDTNLDDLEITDDLFNLIDSMYADKEEEK